jgi:hypothetical protein
VVDAGDAVAFDFQLILNEIGKQHIDMQLLELDHALCSATAMLQQLQFLAVTMGLRAELLHGGGLLHWVALSSFTEALATTKRTVRLQNGRRTICSPPCTVSLLPISTETTSFNSVPSSTVDLMERGVPEGALKRALGKLFMELPPEFEMTRYLSGVTPAWDDFPSENCDSDLSRVSR